uniref:Prenyl transferase n=1 Tax=Cyanidium caldarium TaxID=2771 RepID=PREA_CYACA|nr:prenyl transferase [Cyanidium caldarium]Q9TLS1.1 RecName: Full=Prenyl transferase [Cyanidium caldarium]AAF12896.1 unknown [Cyanidium caldarium]WDB00133.1 prenyl transferase [Cyanidium caldarium]
MKVNSKTLQSVKEDLLNIEQTLNKLIKVNNPILSAAAKHLLIVESKKIRPAIVLLVAKAIDKNKKIKTSQQRLAEVTEIIHTATLLHDDVVDESIIRRGTKSVNKTFGNKIAVFAGDFLFAQSSWYLANINNLEVVKAISKVITDLAEGELQQNLTQFNTYYSIIKYLEKSFNKTASLIAASCKSCCLLSDFDQSLNSKFYNYGKNLGLAFQIIDDILDITSSSTALGKMTTSDLKLGNLTAPVLFALTKNSKLFKIIEREFCEKSDISEAINIIKETNAIEESFDLAYEHIEAAINSIKDLPTSSEKDSLIEIAYDLLNRYK